jgi:hypothetical protein
MTARSEMARPMVKVRATRTQVSIMYLRVVWEVVSLLNQDMET